MTTKPYGWLVEGFFGHSFHYEKTAIYASHLPDAKPLYDQATLDAAVAAERKAVAQWLDGQGQPGYAHEIRFRDGKP